MNPSVFREYDIRGLADQELTDPFCWALGRLLGKRAKEKGEINAYVGQDVRVSSPRLARALGTGLRAAGLDVRLLEPGPTPLTYFAATVEAPPFATKTGIMVTGSHNPAEYNGFKMVVAGKTLFGDDIRSFQDEVLAGVSEAPAKMDTDFIELRRSEDYIRFIRNNIRPGRRLKVVIDAGNGAAGELAIASYEAIGCDVVPIFCEPDGRFPNHHPDPTVAKNLTHLIAKVREVGADLGIGFDGDGDRIGAVTAQGKILYGDHLVLYFARDILADQPGATIISEVKSSQVLYDVLAKWGANPVLWKTGHSLIKAKLKETKGALAGEMSGHMFFSHRYFGFDDAIYAGARLIEGLRFRDETLDEFMDSLPSMVNTPEIRVDCADDKKFDVVKRFTERAKKDFGSTAVNDIDGARIKMLDGWGLLRASNTQPVLVLRFEAGNAANLKKIRDSFATILKDIDSTISVP